MKKILFNTHLYNDFPEEIEKLKESHPGTSFVYADSISGLKREIRDAHAVVWGHPKAEILEEASELEVIFIPFTGVNRLDFEYLRRRGITVSNNHGNSSIVAERALALAMALTGRVVEFHNDMKEGDWHRRDNSKNPFDFWTSIQNKPVSILGCGGIGRNIARLMKGFKCNILGFKREVTKRVDGFDQLTSDLTAALEFGEIIFLALPLTESTQGIINSGNVELLRNKFLINVARGELIDEETLYTAVSHHILSGAAIDSWYNYPNRKAPYALPSRYDLHRFKNVIVSPHAASHSIEGKIFQLRHTIDNIRAYLENGQPHDIVDLEHGY